MAVSEHCLNLIMDFEGLRLDAYLDSVGVPTIGYGTTQFPNGRKVAIGDSITEEKAEAFLKFDCDRIGKDILEKLGSAQLNQNQFDALVSFCYNLGMGAFGASTLFSKIKVRDFSGASAEFLKWNKGTIHGIKIPIRGLTRRREKERELFDSATTAIPAETDDNDVSPEEMVTCIELVKSKGQNFLLAFDRPGQPRKLVQIVQFENQLADTLLSTVHMYPNLKSFDFADSNTTIPAGGPVIFAGGENPIPKSAKPKLTQLLVTGVRDDAQSNNVAEVQARLRDLGYFRGEIDGIFGPVTDAAAREFQRDFFGSSEADGKVGPRTWDKLWDGNPAVQASTPQTSQIPDQNYLLLTKTDSKDQYGLFKLSLAYFKGNEFQENMNVCSGSPRRQIFRTGKDSPARSMEPLPEGKWRLHDVEWAAGKKDVYDKEVWSEGLGPAKIELDYMGPGSTPRSGIEIHIDWNRSKGSPGTAGCVGILNIADFRKLVGWLGDPNLRFLYVNWNKGTFPVSTPR